MIKQVLLLHENYIYIYISKEKLYVYLIIFVFNFLMYYLTFF